MRFTVLALFLTATMPAWSQGSSSGTGFAVAAGLLVTNHHIVEKCAAVEVIASDGRRTATVIDAEPQVDLALLRVFGLRGATAGIRAPQQVRLGEPVFVFGFPLAGALSSGGNFTNGVVSALHGLRNRAGEIQITAPIQPGNSGGPVMDVSGVVIGVVVSKLDAIRVLRATGDIPQNVNFAVSLDTLAAFLDRNKVAYRSVQRASPIVTDRIATTAQNFTYRVECQSVVKEAARPVPPVTMRPPSVDSVATPTTIAQSGNFLTSADGLVELLAAVSKLPRNWRDIYDAVIRFEYLGGGHFRIFYSKDGMRGTFEGTAFADMTIKGRLSSRLRDCAYPREGDFEITFLNESSIEGNAKGHLFGCHMDAKQDRPFKFEARAISSP
jgi:hypothetical protein